MYFQTNQNWIGLLRVYEHKIGIWVSFSAKRTYVFLYYWYFLIRKYILEKIKGN